MLLPSQIEEVIVANLDCVFIEVKGDDGTHLRRSPAHIACFHFEALYILDPVP